MALACADLLVCIGFIEVRLKALNDTSTLLQAAAFSVAGLSFYFKQRTCLVLIGWTLAAVRVRKRLRVVLLCLYGDNIAQYGDKWKKAVEGSASPSDRTRSVIV